MDKITERILADLGDTALLDKLLSLPGSDLNSFLLKLFDLQAAGVAPRALLKAYEQNRFALPSAIDPAEYHRLEAHLLTLAGQMGMRGVLLSPAAPVGSCSAFGYVAQNNVVSALRGSEILSDPTNMLAIYVAGQLKRKALDNETPQYFCTTARVLRAQKFPEGMFSHFGLFCIVSSGKDKGSYSCERAMLIKHMEFYKQLLRAESGAGLSLALRKRSGYTDGDGFFTSIGGVIRDELPDVPISIDEGDQGNGYYKGVNFKLNVENDGASLEVGDGGFVDWIQSMTGNGRERCLISCIAIDRYMLL